MYGSVVRAGETKHAVFEWGVPIPMEVIRDEKIMTRVRNFALYNVDLPGNIEDVHPNKFFAGNKYELIDWYFLTLIFLILYYFTIIFYSYLDLRPIEEFRHTPVIPISEKDLKNYKNKIEDKNRLGVYFEVKKQTLYYYGIACLFVLILFQTFRHYYKESENMQTELEKIRLRRLRYREDDDVC